MPFPRLVRPSGAALCLGFFLAACGSNPDEVEDAPERQFEIESGAEALTPGARLIRTKTLIDAWLAAKSTVPRTVEVERKQVALESSLKRIAEEDLPLLLTTLRNGDSKVHRSTAAQVLGFSAEDTGEVLETLLGALERDPSPAVRSDALVGIGLLASRRTPLDPLLRVVESGRGEGERAYSNSTRIRSAYAILRVTRNGAGNETDGERLQAILADRTEDYAVTSQIALAAAGIGVRTATTGAVLSTLLDHPVPRVETAAIQALAELLYRPAAPVLVQRLSANDPAIRLAAQDALQRIFERDYGTDPAAWRAGLGTELEGGDGGP